MAFADSWHGALSANARALPNFSRARPRKPTRSPAFALPRDAEKDTPAAGIPNIRAASSVGRERGGAGPRAGRGRRRSRAPARRSDSPSRSGVLLNSPASGSARRGAEARPPFRRQAGKRCRVIESACRQPGECAPGLYSDARAKPGGFPVYSRTGSAAPIALRPAPPAVPPRAATSGGRRAATGVPPSAAAPRAPRGPDCGSRAAESGSARDRGVWRRGRRARDCRRSRRHRGEAPGPPARRPRSRRRAGTRKRAGSAGFWFCVKNAVPRPMRVPPDPAARRHPARRRPPASRPRIRGGAGRSGASPGRPAGRPAGPRIFHGGRAAPAGAARNSATPRAPPDAGPN